jgi:hypothetical protein
MKLRCLHVIYLKYDLIMRWIAKFDFFVLLSILLIANRDLGMRIIADDLDRILRMLIIFYLLWLVE